ncbi:protein bicaudal C homolog 1-like [Branchiostoma lanceolatum]|uniref:protein bicaudal C homolog 1-like n=1 Tax=Branchiostoma lanceolatum TaxID=7740 RepID=UPI00345227FD
MAAVGPESNRSGAPFLGGLGPTHADMRDHNSPMDPNDSPTESIEPEETIERPPDWVEERFRVDRRKLEAMLQAAAEGRGQTGEEFFQKIMDETITHITWPSKLKIGAKSKKDPHIKVAGREEDVRAAKTKIMAVLDTKSNRVTLKMDVSHTEHSHVIGKGGNNIKKVMQETGCHIHFPDSNRSSLGEKSNQVSIAGLVLGVESARAQIRELLPLVFMFELPITGALQPVPDVSSPQIQQIQQTYNVTVAFKQRPRMYVTTCVVRGTVNNAPSVKEATARLIDHLTGNMGQITIPVSTQLDIATQHHLFMIGRGGVQIKQIMQRTGASIHFPDPNNPQKKSMVFVSGGIESVYLARQQLIGCLPLVLMFDMKEDVEVDTSKMARLMEELDVFISIKPKPKQPSKSVIVKSVERNAPNMYRARCRLLGLEESENIPPSTSPQLPTINISSDVKTSCATMNGFTSGSLGLNSLGIFGYNAALNINTTPTSVASLLSIANGHVSPLHSPQPSPPGTTSPSTWGPSSPSNPPVYSIPPMVTPTQLSGLMLSPGFLNFPTHTPSPPPPPGLPNPSPPPPPGLAPLDGQVNNVTSQVADILAKAHHPVTSHDKVHVSYQTPTYSSTASAFVRVPTPNTGDQVPPSSASSPGCSPRRSPVDQFKQNGRRASSPGLPGDVEVRMLKSGNSFVDVVINHSPSSSGNSTDLNMLRKLASLNKQTVELVSGVRNAELHMADRRSSESGESDCSDKRAPGCERERERELEREREKFLRSSQNLPFNSPYELTAFDYERKKLQATKAMQKKPQVTQVRTPTDTWSGFGFSKSMPSCVAQEAFESARPSYKAPTLPATYESTSGPPSPTEPSPPSVSPWGERNGSSLTQQEDFPSENRRKPPHKYDFSLSASNYIDSVSLPSKTKWSCDNDLKATDLPDLFMKLGLGKYSDVFQQQEIDLQTFMTLTDLDLKELGITTFGARRKMLLAISDLNKPRRKSLFTPFPNAYDGDLSGRSALQHNPDLSSALPW